ncbi:GNAT family N-acetyltransferase [Microlunatus elymi]|uniref:GNAT family N-acetyltransferase n=1 Tax=Microlunatus elymi TaxID=2596828 RepID=A0A516PYY3_9ACTN|nr:GNAT family N-acetyltransferase [Microlunatus elymi]QDP96385.1 GNAT family N-acetyltransferase [Microlunatus elymi]
MSLSVRQLTDPNSPDLETYQDLYVRAERAIRPDAAVHSLGELRAVLGPTSVGMWFGALAAEDDDDMVGAAWLSGSLTDNLHAGSLGVWVPPERAGRGVGSALLAEAERRMILDGRREVTARIILDGNGSAAHRGFAEARGFRCVYSEVERRLSLPLPEARLAELESRVLPYRDGYRIEAFAGPIPERWAQGYCDVSNRLVLDAPHGDLEVEERRRTPEILVGQELEITSSGRRRVTALALAADGSVVGLCSCVLPEPGSEEVDQWGTVVDRDHRGHRLGLSVKLACYRLIQELPGDHRLIRTGNAETNRWMIAINEALGFEVYTRTGVFGKRLVGGCP